MKFHISISEDNILCCYGSLWRAVCKCEEPPRRTPVELVPLGEVGAMTLAESTIYEVKNTELGWGLSLQQHLGSINSEMRVKEKSIHWHCYT